MHSQPQPKHTIASLCSLKQCQLAMFMIYFGTAQLMTKLLFYGMYIGTEFINATDTYNVDYYGAENSLN